MKALFRPFVFGPMNGLSSTATGISRYRVS